MKEKISVIIPVYKVEKYLSKCVDSVLNQTYTNIEVILVDDGSPDSCPEICDNYKGRDRRIKVIHKQNGGLSDARNAALEIAEGDYISFVDSDDWVDDNLLKVLHDALTRTNADMSISNMVSVTETGMQSAMRNNVDHEVVLEGSQIWSTLNQPCAPTKLYNAAIWKDLRFPVGRLYEDAFIYHHILEKVTRLVQTDKTNYYYLLRQGSIMHTAYDVRFTDIIDAVEDRISTLEKYGQDEYVEKNRLFIYSQSAVALAHLDMRKEVEKKKRQEVWKIYKKHFPKLLRNRYASTKEKILFCLLRFAPRIHSKLYGMKMPLNLGG